MDNFSQLLGDIEHTQHITMDIDTRDLPPIAQKPYTLPLKHTQYVKKLIKSLKKVNTISGSISPVSNQIVMFPKCA